jgi:hypothetical protein
MGIIWLNVFMASWYMGGRWHPEPLSQAGGNISR